MVIYLTSETNADKLKRSIHITGRVKSDNEKGYYFVDAINDAMNAGPEKIKEEYRRMLLHAIEEI